MATALTWRIDLAPKAYPNIDASWAAGLYLAAEKGIHFGPDLAFVYGPLGFLSRPSLYYTAPAALATLAVGLAYLGSLGLFARRLWLRLGPAGATVLTLLAASATAFLDGPERVEAIFLLLALGIVFDDGREPGRWALAGLASLTALMGLVKLSSGAVMLAMLVIVALLPALRRRPWRDAATSLGIALGSLVVVGVALWLISGQSLFDIPDYLRNGREVISGNPENVSIEVRGHRSDYWLAVISAVALGIAALFALRPLRRANGVAGALLLALYTWVAFRHGFTRHDRGHVPLFFAPLLLALAALVPTRGQRWTRARMAQAGAVAAAAIALGIGSMAYRNFSDLFRFSSDPLVNTVVTLSSQKNRVRLREGARKQLQGVYALTPALLARVRGQTMHVDPSEAGVAWAYPSIRWRPVPLFQAFTAYTSGLDELDARYLGSKKAPRYVLHQNLSIDNRNPRFESPGYVVELVCRYRQVAVAGGWQLLERGPDRCGGPVAIDKRRVKLGQVVRVPKAGRNDIVVARFQDLHESLWQSLRGLVFKRRPLYVTVGGGRVNRFLPGHADSPHLLQPPACSGYDPALFDSSSYPMIGVAHAGRIGKPEASGDYELRIYRVPFRCPDSLPAR